MSFQYACTIAWAAAAAAVGELVGALEERVRALPLPEAPQPAPATTNPATTTHAARRFITNKIRTPGANRRRRSGVIPERWPSRGCYRLRLAAYFWQPR